MIRLAWSQLRFRATRAIALLAGLLIATTAFTVLTAASRTAELRTIGTVSAHFAPAYDILIRPAGARTAQERRTGTVQPNFLSGTYGGITLSQYHQIAQIPGVQVAAPIAMVGYTLVTASLTFQVPVADAARPGRQVYRISTTWVSDGGASRISQPPSYLYVTPDPLRIDLASGGRQVEIAAGGAAMPVCGLRGASPSAAPFGTAAQSRVNCWSTADGTGTGLPGAAGASLARGGPARFTVDWEIPMLIAAIDPAAEARLDGLNHAVTAGHYLPERPQPHPAAGGLTAVPVLISSSAGLGETAVTTLQLLPAPSAPPVLNLAWEISHATTPARTVLTVRTTAQQAYASLQHDLSTAVTSPYASAWATWGYWTVGPATYRHAPGGARTPLLVHNAASTWYTGGIQPVPVDNEDSQYRAVTVHAPAIDLTRPHPATPGTPGQAVPIRVGVFDPTRIASFDPLSQVPLGVYQPVAAAPATAASRRALNGRDLLPNQNLGGYVSQPADLITTLSALPALENSYYGDAARAADPISVIRVRVAGVTGPNPVSLERIREVAQQIAVRTHLTVDIVAGSSPVPAAIGLPAGKFGRPALTLTENWVKKGVAVAILTAIDKKSAVLFVLILIVCGLFVANSAAAAVRGRRRELGVLACLGWTRPRLFAAVLGEIAGLGLTAGILGAAAALPLSAAVGLRAAPGRAALAVPVAVAVAVSAGAVPAWLAARAEPVASVRPPVAAIRHAHQPGGVTGLALVNVLRTPGRTALGAVSLAVGVTAVTTLAAITFAFRGVVVGSLLGDAVAVQVRAVDYVAGVATVVLGVLAVTDVVILGIRERAAELATLRALGWPESALGRLVVTECLLIGMTGALTGAVLGLAAAAVFAGQVSGRLYVVAVITFVTGALVIAGAAALPARALRHRPAARLLAEE